MKEVKTTKITDLPTIPAPKKGKVFVNVEGKLGWTEAFDENGVLKLKAELDKCVETLNNTINSYNAVIADLQSKIAELSSAATANATTTSTKTTKKKSKKDEE